MDAAPDNIVTIKLAAQVFGLSVNAIRGKIHDGHWRQGVEYHRAPDGKLFVDRSAVRQWIASRQPTVSRG